VDLTTATSSLYRNWANTPYDIHSSGTPFNFNRFLRALRPSKIFSYPQAAAAHRPTHGIYSPGVKSVHGELPMNKAVEVVLTALALAGMYCAIPKAVAPVGDPVIQTQQSVLMADGSDPMPFCRRLCK